MIRIGIFLVLPLALSCAAKSNSEIQNVQIQKQQDQSKVGFLDVDTVKLDLDRSKLFWKGSKMWGTGSHEGEVRISKGWLFQNFAGLTGGKFELDMTSISITDIPKSDPIPIKNLTEHLMQDDFFDVGNFPTSKFEIIEMKYQSFDSLFVSGNLTIRGITKNITFAANQKHDLISAHFLIDRFDWNIAYEGSWADRTLVDRDIEIRIQLVLSDELSLR